MVVHSVTSLIKNNFVAEKYCIYGRALRIPLLCGWSVIVRTVSLNDFQVV